jgi:hypothetical protein
MARKKGMFYQAGEWFKDALSVNEKLSEAWSLLGNLHISKEGKKNLCLSLLTPHDRMGACAEEI